MNNKFYELSVEKQNRIKNAGYKAFGENVYKKASMKMIADDAYISKSLLFHYFKNKRELYEWLFHSAVEEMGAENTLNYQKDSDFFYIIHDVISKRIVMMEQLTLQYQFFKKAYDESILGECSEIKSIIAQMTEIRKQKIIALIDKSKFKNYCDIPILYDLINDLATGYYERNMNAEWEMGSETLQVFEEYLNSLKKYYYKEV